MALALLFPIEWPEPFGLVMIEAMACGTPVIAFRHGSVPEIIEDGVSGFIVENEIEALERIACVHQLDRRGTGTVKWFNASKGFGFIQPDSGGQDVFVHISAVERAGMNDLKEGQKIGFELEDDRKSGKKSAGNLKRI